LGGQAQVLCLDVTQTEQVESGIARLLRHGPIDVLVNNAGVCSQVEFLRQSVEQQQTEMAVNYFGVQNMTRALLPSFVTRRQGAIVNVSSLLGSSAAPTTANYAATKAALEAYSQGLRGEVSRFGVRVTVFVAPHTQTELGCHTEFRGVRSLPVAYVATQLVRAIDRMPARAAAGPVYCVLLRLSAWFPRWMERQMLQSVEHLLNTGVK
jgi:3-oxoacyl-[acyl-carrier protein] reductase